MKLKAQLSGLMMTNDSRIVITLSWDNGLGTANYDVDYNVAEADLDGLELGDWLLFKLVSVED